jgi:putative oxidoreductase
MTLTVVGAVIGALGAGQWSLDHAIGVFDPPGAEGLLISAGAGGLGAAALLAIFWRPPAKAAP